MVRDIVRGVEGVITLEGQVQFIHVSKCGERCTGRINLVVNGIVAIECDGRAYHGDDTAEADRCREKQPLNQGMLLRGGWKEVDGGSFAGIVQRAICNIEQAPRRCKRRGG